MRPMEEMSHRYAVILAADVARYSTLMEGDGEGTVQALKDCRSVFQRCVSEHHGCEFGSVGDSLMAEFLGPVEALRAARCIHSELERDVSPLPDGDRMQVRIGLHAGDVIDDDHDLFGDVVNTASRVQELAQSGSTAISELVYEQVRKEPDCSFRSLGKHGLKNISDPVQIYEVERRHRRINWRRLRLVTRPYRAAFATVLGVAVIAVMLVVYLESLVPRIGSTLEVAPINVEQSEDKSIAVRMPTDNVRAYQLFVEGKQLFHQRGPAITGALTALQRAVEHDPEFVEAWAYLAASASIAWGYDTGISKDETDQLAETATRKALELDPNSGLALAVLGHTALNQDDYRSAAEHFRHAVRSDPDNSTVRMWAGVFFFCLGYLEDALESLERAYELNPDTGIVNGYVAMTLLSMGHGDMAKPYLLRAEEQAFFHHAATRFNYLVFSGDLEGALEYRKKFYASDSTPGAATTQLTVAEALRSGNTTEVAKLVDEGVTAQILPGNWNMSLFLALDMEDHYFDELSSTVSSVPYWRMAMRFFWLEGNRKYIEHPRFFAIMREAGVVELWEVHGYPDGCTRIADVVEEHLNCDSRFG